MTLCAKTIKVVLLLIEKRKKKKKLAVFIFANPRRNFELICEDAFQIKLF